MIAAKEGRTNVPAEEQAFLLVRPNQKRLEEIANLLDSQMIVPVVDAVVPFRSTADAYKRNVRNRLGRGKLVVDFASDNEEVQAL